MRTIPKPQPGEYPEYSQQYMDLCPDDGKILEHLADNFIDIKKFIYDLPKERLLYRYEEGKWTVKEILLHIIDDERIFAYRALSYARNDKTPLPGFDEKAYAAESGANDRSLDSIFEEYETVRKATITLFDFLPEEALARSGTGVDIDGTTQQRTVRSLVYHIAGHELWHMKIIKERYLFGKVVLK